MKKRIKTWWNHTSYKKRLVISYGIIVLIACIGIGLFSLVLIQKEENYQKNMILEGLTWSAGSRLNEVINNTETALLQFITDSQIKATLRDDDITYYQRWLRLNDVLLPKLQYITLQIRDAKSIIIYTENEMLHHPPANILSLELIEDKEWFDKVKEETPILWIAENDQLYCIARISNPENVQSYIVTTLHPSSILNADNQWNEQWDFLLQDGKDIKLKPSLSPLNEEAFDLRAIEKEYWINTYDLCNDWQFVLLVRKSEIIYHLTEILTLVCVAYVIIIILFIISVVLFSEVFSKRIIRLNGALQKVIDGNRQIALQDDSNDEIGQLTKSFNTMMAGMNHLIEDVLENKIARREAELTALRSQIKPHFLYNVLSTINWMAINEGCENISLVATSISDYYRTMLNGGQEKTTLQHELENIQAYLTFQSIAHDDSFAVEYNIPEELMTCEFLTLILQPIVENAVCHGIDKRTSEVGGLIQIWAKKEEKALIIGIEDNGPGISEDYIKQITEGKISPSAEKSYGIRNVCERIQLRAGKEYGLSFYHKTEQGTRVEVRYPYRKKEYEL